MAKYKYQYLVHVNEQGAAADPTVWAAIQGAMRRYAGKKCKITVEPTTRTLLQNSTIHGVFQEITDRMAEAGVVNPETGEPYTFDTWREYFLDKHCPRMEITIPRGNGVFKKTVRMSTADMNTAEFAEVLNKIVTAEVLISRGIYIEIKRKNHDGN